MTEQRFREIQLTAKQLVFLFMASVVVAVSIFLLGVSVGRGVRGTTQASAEPVADPAAVEPPVRMPPETKMTPADYGYAKLQGQTAAPPASAPTREQASQSAQSPPAPTTAPPSKDQAKPADAPPARAGSPAAGGYFVQTDAFAARANADKRVAELKAKGHAAFVVTPGPPFRVRIGPFTSQPAAEKIAAQLQTEGLKPSVTR